MKKTYYELMPGRAPRVSHFRCFILQKSKLGKFEARFSDGIFLGYASHCRAYHVLSLDTNKIMNTCEATFDRHNHVVRLFLSVQVMTKLAKRSFRMRRMKLEKMMVMMVNL
jgi:hypothetical protein